MTTIAEGDGYILEVNRHSAGEYSLFLTHDGWEHELLFDEVFTDGSFVTIARRNRAGVLKGTNLDPGVLETEVGPVLEAIADGLDPRREVGDE